LHFLPGDEFGKFQITGQDGFNAEDPFASLTHRASPIAIPTQLPMNNNQPQQVGVFPSQYAASFANYDNTKRPQIMDFPVQPQQQPMGAVMSSGLAINPFMQPLPTYLQNQKETIEETSKQSQNDAKDAPKGKFCFLNYLVSKETKYH